MKTIVRKADKIAIYLLNDNVEIELKADCVVVGNPANFVIGDCHAGNVDVFENVTNPDDWFGWKYKYENNQWTLNPEWVDPRGSKNL